MKLDSRARQYLNRELQGYSKQYYSGIPLDIIFSLLDRSGITVVQEDGTQWSGIICGNEGRTTFDLAINKDEQWEEISNSVLVLSWYKFHTGRYEINAYVS